MLPKTLPPRLTRRWNFAPVPEFCSHVKRLPEREGEILNLSNREAQNRSLAALLAKKHWKPRSRLSSLYAISRERELTVQECCEVFKIVDWRHGDLDE